MVVAGPQPHGRRRDRALLNTLVAGVGLQGAVVVAAVFSLPFVSRTLPANEFGVYVVITGSVALFAFADFGIGAALTDRLAAASGKDDSATQSFWVSTAVAGVSLAAGTVALLGTVLTFALPWQRLFGAPSIPTSTLQAAVLCMVVATSLSIVGGIGQRVLYGLQRGDIANSWLIPATLAGAAAVVSVSLVHGPLWAYVGATAGVPALVSLVCTWWVLDRGWPALRPRWSLVRWAGLHDLAGRSGWFLVLAVAGAAAYQTDSLVVSAVLGAASAGVYSVAMRLFGLISQVLYPALAQLWPAFSEAFGRGDVHWVVSRFRRSMVLSGAVAGAAGLGVVVIGPAVVSLWLGPDLAPPRSLLVALAVWTAYSLATSPIVFLLNAAGRVRANGLMALSAAFANVAVSILLTRQIGISGPVLGSLVSHIVFVAIPGAVLARRVLADARAGVSPT